MAASTQRSPRLYIERELDGETLTLDEREAHYLAHVLRLQRGNQLIVFNGRGTERQAGVEAVLYDRVRVELVFGGLAAGATGAALHAGKASENGGLVAELAVGDDQSSGRLEGIEIAVRDAALEVGV